MPIKFISLNEDFLIDLHKIDDTYELLYMRVEHYEPDPLKKTYYVSPANSLGFMDGGIDFALSIKVFPGIEDDVMLKIETCGKENLLGRKYLPIGSSIIFDKPNNTSLIVAPTMLLPQKVKNTNNAYYATMAILHNILINRQESLENVDILFTSFCCGYGQMDISESIKQILKGINDYVNYKPTIINRNYIFNEPNLAEQPKYYQNLEWFKILPNEIVRP